MSQDASTTTENTEQFGHEVQPSDWETLYAESQEENTRLKAVISSARLAPTADHSGKDLKPAVTFERLTALLGTHGVNKLTRSEKISALGENPANIDDAFLHKCFGKGNDGSAAADLFKTSPLRYRTLKEISKALQLYCA